MRSTIAKSRGPNKALLLGMFLTLCATLVFSSSSSTRAQGITGPLVVPREQPVVPEVQPVQGSPFIVDETIFLTGDSFKACHGERGAQNALSILNTPSLDAQAARHRELGGPHGACGILDTRFVPFPITTIGQVGEDVTDENGDVWRVIHIQTTAMREEYGNDLYLLVKNLDIVIRNPEADARTSN